jgi:DNA-binding NarL/FixJ family response regulator
MIETTTLVAPKKVADPAIKGQDSQTSQSGSGQSVRIFLVDDSADFLLGATRFLSLTPRFEVVGTATSGKFALEQIGQLKPDLVIMDLVMPGMSGIEAARILKTQTASVRLIMTSFQDGPEYQMSAREVGADAFISKSGFGEQVNTFIDSLFTPPNKD